MPWVVRVIKRFQWAHYLTSYGGKPEPLHGHTWKVEVFIRCEELDEEGLCVDFLKVERTLEELLPKYGLINEAVDFSPSAENLAKWIYGRLKERFPNLTKVAVWETEECGAEYYEEDRHHHG